MASRRKLLHVFREVERLIRLPDNDYSYAGWDDTEDALAEIMPTVERIRQNKLPIHSDFLFLPTGPLQETSLSSGWGDEFCAIADEYDVAIAAPADCPCFTDPIGLLEAEQPVGMDEKFGEVSTQRCSKCGQQWVRYLLEDEAFSRSGRWYLGAIDGQITVESARGQLEACLEFWCGGSYFDGKVTLTSGKIY